MVVFTYTVSLVLFRVAKGAQKLVYYISKALKDIDTHSDIKKLAFALFLSSKKLCSYFQSHTIMVVTSYPLCIILRSLDVVERLMKWSIALSEFHIVYQARATLKA